MDLKVLAPQRNLSEDFDFFVIDHVERRTPD
jgi:hypothetical protein